jgi:Rps23 Pro-64 3,4-dihydroxylase Tpa1-like proline 4-hydroxylase
MPRLEPKKNQIAFFELAFGHLPADLNCSREERGG